jgi:DNA helicase-2/ATP-dependent DNA helicase PcrA
MLQLYPKVGKATAEKIWRSVSSGVPNPWAALNSKEMAQKVPAGGREGWPALLKTLSQLRKEGRTSDPAGMIEGVMGGGYEAYLQAKYPNFESRADDLRQLAVFAGQYTSCQDFLSDLALLTSIEGEAQPFEGGDGMLTLSSVHQAKGLEWSAVFIIWLAEGRFPSQRSLSDSEEEGEEEERRLFYVAVTRAKDKLYLCYPRYAPDRGGREMIQQASRFISELGREEYEKLDPDE